MNPEERRRLERLLRETRWAALATARDDEPYASWVAVVPTPELDGFLLHLSRLAQHTRYLLVNPRVSLTFSEPDDGRADPQELVRVSLQGGVTLIPRDTAADAQARAQYLARLPAAAQTFELGDFEMYLFTPQSGRYVSGFGRTYRLLPDELRALGKAAPA